MTAPPEGMAELQDAGQPESAATTDIAAPDRSTEVFSADAQVLPSTANSKDGTIDVVWYSGPLSPGSTAPPASRTCSSSPCRAAASTA
jgi:hypothetical protein